MDGQEPYSGNHKQDHDRPGVLVSQDYGRETQGEMIHYAYIPKAVVKKLLQDGLDVFKEENKRKVIDLLNSQYKHLKK